MEISIEELNTLLEKEFERGRHSVTYCPIYPCNYTSNTITTPQKIDFTVTCDNNNDNNNCVAVNSIGQQRDELIFTC